MKRAGAHRLAVVALAALAAFPVLAFATDKNLVEDFWPAQTALSDCGRDYVRVSTVPTVSGAQARCSAQFERLMKAVAYMARMSQPRMGGPTPEWENEVAAAVARDRTAQRDDFAKSVQEWIAERQR
jgi:hypothetical protein